MAQAKQLSEKDLKQALKEAVAETLQANPKLLRDALTEAIEDVALAGAIRAGKKTKPSSRAEVFRSLRAWVE